MIQQPKDNGDLGIDVPNGWIKPEKTEGLETVLYVSEKTTQVIGADVAREYIAVYDEDTHYMVEYYDNGSYEFNRLETEDEAATVATELMNSE